MEPVKSMDLLTLNEVAEMLRKTPAQMRWLRHMDMGPKCAKLGGRIVYREADVIAWVEAAFAADGAK